MDNNFKENPDDLLHPFDIVLLTPDIGTWTVQGLDESQLEACLYYTHTYIGVSLRASSVVYEDLEKIKREKIDIGELCLPE